MRVLGGKGGRGSGARGQQGGDQQEEGRDSSDTDPPDVWEVFNSSTDSEVDWIPHRDPAYNVRSLPGASRAPSYSTIATRWSRATTTTRGSQSAPSQEVTDSQSNTSQLVDGPARGVNPEVAEDGNHTNQQGEEAPQQGSPHQHRRRVARTPSPPAQVPGNQPGDPARGSGRRRRGQTHLRRGRPT